MSKLQEKHSALKREHQAHLSVFVGPDTDTDPGTHWIRIEFGSGYGPGTMALVISNVSHQFL
jgi:hypothetical protein